ncbi:MAG: ABC transporter substrate-binding protein [Gammaproteobacteria bacterium]|nr:ABC transporter substrate-binding protein [Gammaproteobacteria bacterium]
MRNLKLLSAATALAMLVGACDSESGEMRGRQEPVVVYASYADESYLPELCAAFTDETGIPVTAHYGTPAQIVDDVIANRSSPPADILLTTSVVDVWRAADRGALRPIKAAGMDAVPPVLKDPEGLWVALEVRYATIGIASHAEPGRVADYRDLANSELSGQLCLSSSALPVNRSLIALLIEDLGVKPAERMVRGWVRNLALSPFATEDGLVAALKNGSCSYGIFSSPIEADGIKKIVPEPRYFDIDAIGVARHARNPESAHRLIDWMLIQKSLQKPASSNGRNIGLAGWRAEDAALLAERAGYR